MNAIAFRNRASVQWQVRLVASASLLAVMPGTTLGATPITITSPANGTVVTPGQALPVTVTVTSGTYPRGVGLIGQNPLGAAGPMTGSPTTFYLTPPLIMPPGAYSITAVATNASSVLVTSAPVTVHVERVDIATTIYAQPTKANLRFVGDTLPLSVDVQYGTHLVKVAVSVPTSTRGDLNGDGRVDQSDLNILMAALNTAATGPNDARDLNHDGVINALDARILVTLCTKPGCATQ